MKKATEIRYNPFDNSLQIRITTNAENPEWEELADNSDLLQYTSADYKVLFSNIAEDVVKVVNEKQNSTYEGLIIYFYGPDSDYAILEKIVERENKNHPSKGELKCKHSGRYYSADDSIKIVKNAYRKISDEFIDYLPGHEKYVNDFESTGNLIVLFNEIISNEIPICVIGTYSTGKSAFINALIGEEILPSSVNPSTAKNVKVIRSQEGRYFIKISYKSEQAETESHFEYEVNDSKLILISSDGPEADSEHDLLKEITAAISDADQYPRKIEERSNGEIIHDILDVLNKIEKEGFLANVGWNLEISVPFTESVLTKTDSTIVFYDTPGSNNANLKRADHKLALKKLMAAQTNALPILMTVKENASSNDVSEAKNLLDEYNENFSSPNCLVILAKADTLVSDQLSQDVSPALKTWHGQSSVLYTTQIGALGIRKNDKENWIDKSYKEVFEQWHMKYIGRPEDYTLPKHNYVPCQGRDIIDAELFSSPELYATGIPSVECEILYYIDHYANYKKAVRGRNSLLKALANIHEELAVKQVELNKASINAKERKARTKEKLLSELDRIGLGSLDKMTDQLTAEYEYALNEYCEQLESILEQLSDGLEERKSLDMDIELNSRFRKHCQEELINKCYYGEKGIQKRIINIAEHNAARFINYLSKFVEKNASVISNDGMNSIKDYFAAEVKPPEFQEIESILDNFGELLGKAALVEYGILNITNNPDLARQRWLKNKRNYFEKCLRDGNGLMNKAGLFKRSAVKKPIEEYDRQLQAWAENYITQIRSRLESDNAYLSGMEDEIREINASIDDITSRLDNVADVEEKLKHMTDQI